jgi:L-amino acid N-acyltransferase YncA
MVPRMIRDARPDDLPAITEIYAEAVRTGTASFELEPPSLDEMRRRFDIIAGGGFPYIVAEEEGVVAGYAYAGPYRPRPAYGYTVENSIYLNAPFRGRGLGRALLDALIADAEAKGFRQMIAVIGDSDNTPSIKVHAAAGFEMTGTFRSVGRKHGRWLDTVLMQRALGSGDGEPPGREPGA